MNMWNSDSWRQIFSKVENICNLRTVKAPVLWHGIYADFGVSVACSRQEWSCKTDLGSRRPPFTPETCLATPFSILNEKDRLRKVRTKHMGAHVLYGLSDIS